MDFQKDIGNCLAVLLSGGIILYPTDTVWGLGCDATNPQAVQKIYMLKQRQESKSMIVLLAEEREILKYVAEADLSVFNYLANTTRPTTVIYNGALGMADNLIAPDGSIAIRIVQDEFCRNLIKRLKKPLVSTSANISGQPAPPNFQAIDPYISGGVDYIVQYRQNDITPAQPSVIIRWNKDGSITTLRK
ncbi:MAG: L-threonylcarbamoyladenylate synthase [Chitinophagaceae bacterium]|nr:L-threonylcarbamoyladenylate synthase [Chitinophagaceae bacterium]